MGFYFFSNSQPSFQCPQAYPLRWVGLFYLLSCKNKRPMERSPWAFIFPQLPTLFSMPSSPPTALGGALFFSDSISGFPAFAENDRVRIWSKSFLIHKSDFLFVLRSVQFRVNPWLKCLYFWCFLAQPDSNQSINKKISFERSVLIPWLFLHLDLLFRGRSSIVFFHVTTPAIVKTGAMGEISFRLRL